MTACLALGFAILSPLLSPFFYDLSISSYAKHFGSRNQSIFSGQTASYHARDHLPTTNQPIYLSLIVPRRDWMTTTITVHLLRTEPYMTQNKLFPPIPHHTIPHHTPHTHSLTQTITNGVFLLLPLLFPKRVFVYTYREWDLLFYLPYLT